MGARADVAFRGAAFVGAAFVAELAGAVAPGADDVINKLSPASTTRRITFMTECTATSVVRIGEFTDRTGAERARSQRPPTFGRGVYTRPLRSPRRMVGPC
jgi:hypothetical protein